MRGVRSVSLVFLVAALGAVASPAAHARARVPAVHSDFNGDGISDLAISAAWETVDGQYAAGGVNVLLGSAQGLSSAGNQFWTQDSPGVPDQAETGDNFGSALASGDFNGDGIGDLAIGSPNESTGSRFGNGAITVLFGSSSGLTSTGAQFIAGSKSEDSLGYSLAAGDFNGDGIDDLAAGLPYRISGGQYDAGALQLFTGGAGGLQATSQTWTQDSPGVPDQSEAGDAFGWAAAAGDFNADGRDDLAVSAYEESFDAADQAGAVTVLYGSDLGLTSTGAQQWSQGSGGILDQAESDDEFGYAMAAGDLNGDGAADLTVGAFGESIGTATYAGSVNVIYGSPAGLTSAGNQFWTQASAGVPGDPGTVDRFGSALAIGDMNGDAVGDLAIGVPRDVVGSVSAGDVDVLFGSGAGLTSTGAQVWSQGSPGIKDNAEDGDEFGSSVAVADWNADGPADLAVGAPYESTPALPSYPGSVNAIYGSGTGLISTGNQLWTQDSPGILDRSENDDFFGYAMG
jgi:hypothetical protein